VKNVVPIRDPDDDDVIGIAPEPAPLLDCTTVDAVCTSCKKVYFPIYRKSKFVLTFQVVEPGIYAGVELYMFINFDDGWRKKRIPKSSKLFKSAVTASGRMSGGQAISYSLWLHKLFRCAIRTTGAGDAQYSIVDRLIEKLTS
jgi:hypothetical protein